MGERHKNDLTVEEINSNDRANKTNALWQKLLDQREENRSTTSLSDTDQLIQNISEAIFEQNQSPYSPGQSVSPLNNNIDNTPPSEVKKYRHINLQLENIQLAVKTDDIFSQKIMKQGKKTEEKINEQKGLLKLKSMLPKDITSTDKLTLSDEAIKLIEELNTKYDLDLDATDITNLRQTIDSHLDTLRMEIQQGFTELQVLNHEKNLLFQLAQLALQNDDKKKMVHNQTAR